MAEKERLRVLVVDDEAPARKDLKRILGTIAGVEIAGEAGEGHEAVKVDQEAAARRRAPRYPDAGARRLPGRLAHRRYGRGAVDRLRHRVRRVRDQGLRCARGRLHPEARRGKASRAGDRAARGAFARARNPVPISRRFSARSAPPRSGSPCGRGNRSSWST